MQKKYINKLEYSKVLSILSNYAKTYLGKELCLGLFPITEKEKVQKALQETDEAIRLRYNKGSIPLNGLPSIEIWIKYLKSNTILSMKALLECATTLKIARESKEYFYSDENFSLDTFPILHSYFTSLYTNEGLEKKIHTMIIDENTIADDASSTLFGIRKRKQKIEQEIKEKLNHFIHSSSYSKYIQEPVVTIRNDRYVIPVKEEYRSQIKGFIHDMSSSGSTVFIEPMAIFELNNEINNLKIQENIEIEKILSLLTNLLVPIVEDLENTIRIIARIDFMYAKAEYAIATKSTIPLLQDHPSFLLRKARHPLIEPKVVVPIDISLGETFSTLVITGPNTGGKTVTLKTVGLLTLMGMSGLAIPTLENSSIYVFDHIYADIGDEQSIAESLSTFSSHMLNIIDILEHSTAHSLILVDELGSGTDPIEGSSLAISILESFHQKGALTIATTHYPEIKNYALVTDGFENASQEFDVENLKPTYKLLIGVPGKSNAFAISKKLGLKDSILQRASTYINSQTINIEELLKNIYDDKLKIEKEKEEIDKNLIQIETLRKSLEKDNQQVQNKEKELVQNAKIQARQILLDAKETASSIIKEMTSISQSSTTTKELNNLRNSLNDSIKSLSSTSVANTASDSTIDKKAVSIGMPVYITTLMQEGTILSLPNKAEEVQVQIGSLKTVVSLKNIQPSFKQKNTTVSKSVQPKGNFKTKQISTEINVIGQTVEEANFIIDKYLDDCAIAKLETVRIVHGKGTGKLREGIHAFLKKHPHVKSYRMGTFGEGEMGVTVVELK